jgi:hypothetical protein
MNTYFAPTISPLSFDLFDLFGLRAETAEISAAIADLSKRADAIANAVAAAEQAPVKAKVSVHERRRRELAAEDARQARRDEVRGLAVLRHHRENGIQFKFDNAHGCRN